MSDRVPQLPPVAANPHWLGCRCVVCDREYAPDYDGFVCADCGTDGILDAVYDLGAAARELDVAAPFPPAAAGGLWRFAPLLPVAPLAAHPAWSLGATPLQPAERLAALLGVAELRLKDDTHLPSASLKDRAAAVAVARAVQLGRPHLACASTGNAAASLAVLAARAGLRSTIFVPAGAPRAKLAQLLLHGAQVVRVDGTYDQAFDLSLRELAAHRWYSRNCAHNPLLVEGKKTAALEAALAWRAEGGAPDAVFVSVGDGCIVSSVAKAFLELRELGLCERVPRVYGVQAAGAAPLATAWAAAGPAAAGLDGPAIRRAIRPVVPATIADSISVGIPRNRIKAWRYVARTGGGFLAVPDAEIVTAIRRLAALAGLFAEPSGATAVAGIGAALAEGLIGPNEKILALVTGNGLKDPEAALAGLRWPEPVLPDA